MNETKEEILKNYQEAKVELEHLLENEDFVSEDTLMVAQSKLAYWEGLMEK